MKEYKLEDLFDLQMGKTPSRSNSDYWNEGVYDWISIKDLSNSGKYIEHTKEKLSDIAIEESKIKIIPENTVIMSFKLSIGKVAITPKQMFSNEAIMAFHDKNVERILPEYLYYLFLGKNWIKGSNTAVMGVTLNKTTLSKVKIKLHDFEVQRNIVNILDKCSRMIDLKKQELSELDSLIKSQFVEMFGDSRTNSMQYPTCKLEELSRVGSSKRVFVDELVEKGIPFFRGTEIGALAEGESIIPELFITEEHYMKLKDSTGVPQMGDLLMPSICPDGRIWRVDSEEPFYFKDGRVLWINVKSDVINSVYLQYALKDKFLNDYSNIASGTTFAELKIFALKDIDILMPNIELQNQYAEFIKQVDKLKLEIQKSLDGNKILYDSLMQEYFG